MCSFAVVCWNCLLKKEQRYEAGKSLKNKIIMQEQTLHTTREWEEKKSERMEYTRFLYAEDGSRGVTEVFGRVKRTVRRYAGPGKGMQTVERFESVRWSSSGCCYRLGKGTRMRNFDIQFS